jgi:CRISPR/Cas system-associated endonuclease Cas1
MLTSVSGRNDARLRRQQAAAANDDTGVEIAKLLLGAKLAGQCRIAHDVLHSPVVAESIEALVAALEVAQDLDECRSLEAPAAEAYFSGWRDNSMTTLRFVRTDVSRGRVPSHWLNFDAGRRSLLGAGASNRRPERPLNSLLSLGYFVAAAEARLAIIGVGCDAGFGIIHRDKAGRDGMVYDLLQVARPVIDELI